MGREEASTLCLESTALSHAAFSAQTARESADLGRGVVLDVRGLRTRFLTATGVVRAVDGVDLAVRRGECLGLVGESGCGKSVTALSIMRLVPVPPGRIVAGRVLFGGRDLLALPEREMRRVRGADIAMVLQEPMTSLHPALPVGFQIAEAIRAHRRLPRVAAAREAVELLRHVQIPAPEDRARDYPHQLSGGMRQRVMIAMALAGRPKLIIADEPTTALDVTIQAQIVELFQRIRAESDLAMLLVTHDLGLVAQMADRVAVMYAGRIVETAPVAAIFEDARHPYTRGLLRSVPTLDARGERLAVIPGSVPDLGARPEGCAFHPRCERATAECRRNEPPMREANPDHAFACWSPRGGKTEDR